MNEYINPQLSEELSRVAPENIHVQDTRVTWYFRRQLFDYVQSVFIIDGMPDTWDKDYFYENLLKFGKIAIINTADFGIIPQFCTLCGRNIYNRPNGYQVSSPFFPLQKGLIDVDGAVVKLRPDYGGLWDTIEFYSGWLAMLTEASFANIGNSILAYIATADSKAQAKTLQQAYDEVRSGKPFVVWHDEKRPDNDKNPFELFTNNLSSNYINPKILEDMQSVYNMFLTEIGIENSNVRKRERVTTDEVQSNNQQTKSKAELMCDTINKGLESANRLFGLTLYAHLKEGENNGNNE